MAITVIATVSPTITSGGSITRFSTLISATVAADASGGGHLAAPDALAVPIPTIGKATELSWLLLEDCEVAWDEYVQPEHVTSTADGVTKKIGTKSEKMAVADLAAVG
ncbi:unnamed protein product, partial [marine sediment metagenome]